MWSCPGLLVRLSRKYHIISLSEEIEELRCHERTGRPLVTDSFIARLETIVGRTLHVGRNLAQRGLKRKIGIPKLNMVSPEFLLDNVKK